MTCGCMPCGHSRREYVRPKGACSAPSCLLDVPKGACSPLWTPLLLFLCPVGLEPSLLLMIYRAVAGLRPSASIHHAVAPFGLSEHLSCAGLRPACIVLQFQAFNIFFNISGASPLSGCAVRLRGLRPLKASICSQHSLPPVASASRANPAF